MGIFKRFGYEIRSGNIQPFGRAQQLRTFISNHLVDYIPGIDIILIAPDYGVDMRL
ncbi:hypothetical protein D3C73_1552980 [compost metagenome]